MSDISSQKDILIQTLKDAVITAIDLAREQGIEGQLPVNGYKVMWMEQVDKNHATGVYEDRSEPSFENLYHVRLRNLFEGNEKLSRLQEFCNSFTQEYGKPLAGIGNSVELHGEKILTAYFNSIGTLDLNEQRMNDVCDEYIEEIIADNVFVEAFFLVENFSAPTAFKLDDCIEFRPISDSDINRFGRIEGNPTGIDFPWLNLNHWMCVIQQSGPKNTTQISNEISRLDDHICGALSLTSTGNAIFRFLTKNYQSKYQSGIQHFGNPYTSNGTSTSNGRIELDNDDVDQFTINYQKVTRLMQESKFKHLRLPFRRLRLGVSRPNRNDSLVDYVIGLESLLSSDSPNLETTFRFRLRGASLLPDSFGKPRERIDLLSKLYNLRSKIVHGDESPSEVDEMLPQSEKILKALLLWYIDHAESLGNSKSVVRKLDEAMVSVGQAWTGSTS